MSNYIEYNDKIAFHPGYYLKELVDESGLTQKDFAGRLGTTAKNLSLIIRGEQSLSTDIALKLSRMYDTSVKYWLNLQIEYDSLIAEFASQKEMEKEKEVFKHLDYKYFRDNFNLPDLPRKIEEQIAALRKFLGVSSLCVFSRKDMAINFRSATDRLSEANTIKANIMVQIAINHALAINAPKFNKSILDEATNYALTLTRNHTDFYPLIYNEFLKAGVIFVVLPNLSGSKINGATKKIGDNILLMVNDRRLYSDTFWFTLFHEIGHIYNGDYGISFDHDTTGEDTEDLADKYAADILIPPSYYSEFVNKGIFTVQTILAFSDKIERDPGIVVGRLQNEGLVDYNDSKLQAMKHLYKVKVIRS